MASQMYVGHTTTLLPDGKFCIWSPQPHSTDADVEDVCDTLMEVAERKKYIFVDWLDYFNKTIEED